MLVILNADAANAAKQNPVRSMNLPRDFAKQYNRLRSDRRSITDRIDALASFGLDADTFDVDPECVCQAVADGIDARPQTWLFEIDGSIDVCDFVAVVASEPDGIEQEFRAFRIAPAVVRIWKVTTDIAESKCSEHCVRCGVQQNIGIRMPVSPHFGFDRNTANNKRATCHESMNIRTKTDSKHM